MAENMSVDEAACASVEMAPEPDWFKKAAAFKQEDTSQDVSSQLPIWATEAARPSASTASTESTDSDPWDTMERNSPPWSSGASGGGASSGDDEYDSGSYDSGSSSEGEAPFTMWFPGESPAPQSFEAMVAEPQNMQNMQNMPWQQGVGPTELMVQPVHVAAPQMMAPRPQPLRPADPGFHAGLLEAASRHLVPPPQRAPPQQAPMQQQAALAPAPSRPHVVDRSAPHSVCPLCERECA